MSHPLFAFSGAGSSGGSQTFSETLTEGVVASDVASSTVMSSTARTVLTLADPAGGDGPIAFDDQLVGRYAESSTGGLFEVTDSSSTGQTVTVKAGGSYSTGDLIAFRADSTGADLLYLEHPAHKSTYGLYARSLDRQDIPDAQNLLSDVASAHLDADSDMDGLADGWNLVTGSSGGTPTVSLSTDPTKHRHGTAAQKVEASPGEGIVSDAVTVSPTSVLPHFVAQAFAQADSGTYQVQLVDATNNDRAYPRSTVDAAKNSALKTPARHDVSPGVDFNDLGTTSLKVQVVARGGSATFYVDAAQLTHRATPPSAMYESRAANRLWHAANDELGREAQPEDRVDVEPIDLYRTDAERWPDDKVEPGNTVLLKDPGLDTDAELRVVRRERNLLTEGDVSLTVDKRTPSLAERIRRSQIGELFDQEPAQSGANRTDGQRPDVLNAGSGPITSSAAPGQYVHASSADQLLQTSARSLTAGQIIVSPFRADRTFTIQSLELEDGGGGAGTIRAVIYSDDGFYPDTLLYESGDLTLDNVGNQITVSGPIIEIEKDQTYWVGIQTTDNSSGTADLRHNGGSATGGMLPAIGFSNTIGDTGFSSLSSTGNGSTVPSVFPASATAHITTPIVLMETPS